MALIANRPRRLAPVLAWTLALLCSSACGDDSSGGDASASEDGGVSGSGGRAGSHGAAGKGGTGERDGGSGTGTDKDGGAGSGSAGTSANGGTGDFDSYWKRRSVHLTIVDAANPLDFKDETVELPDAIENPIDGRKVDLYIQIVGDERHTYAFFEGDEVYYRTTTPVLRSEDTVFDEANDGGTRIYQLMDGVLTDTSFTGMDTISVSAESTYEKAAEFPPKGWPDEMVQTVEVMP